MVLFIIIIIIIIIIVIIIMREERTPELQHFLNEATTFTFDITKPFLDTPVPDALLASGQWESGVTWDFLTKKDGKGETTRNPVCWDLQSSIFNLTSAPKLAIERLRI